MPSTPFGKGDMLSGTRQTNGSYVQDVATTSAQLPASLGSKAPAASMSVTQAGLNYKLAPVSATTTMAQGGAGATGDYLSHVNIQPTSLTLAAFQILDNAVVVHNSAAQTLLDLRQITVPIGAFSVSGAWKVTMGAGGTATGFGIF
jgi:hypothetical protein